MLDLHCHLLPGVDDGPKTLSDTLDLARVLAKAGTTHVVCTPHCHRGLRLLRREIVPRVQELNRALESAGVAIRALPGSEVQLWNLDWVRERYLSGELCLLGDDPAYMLIEFSWNPGAYPPDAPGFVRWLLERGTQPIVAHPERHSFLRDLPQRIEALVDAGAWLQLTVGSLGDEFGAEAQATADDILATDFPLVLASDSHGLWRVSGVEEGLQIVAEEFGPERAQEIRRRLETVETHLTNLPPRP